jgi:hypothetical protein
MRLHHTGDLLLQPTMQVQLGHHRHTRTCQIKL